MQVQGVHVTVMPRPRLRGRAAPSGAAHRRLAAALAAPLRLPDQVPIGRVSKAGGSWQVDWERAHADARRALAAIDFTKPDILLWVPGTDDHGVPHDAQRAVGYLYGAAPRSLSSVDYIASWNLRTSMPTGLATLKLVMEGIRQRFEQLDAAGIARPRLLVAGLSQGSWILGEALTDSRVSSLITRAALVGHPQLANTEYPDGANPRVREYNNPGDQVSMPVAGDQTDALDAMVAVRTGQLRANLPLVLRTVLANPIHGALLLHGNLRDIDGFRPYLRDPHDYRPDMPRVFNYLVTGRVVASGMELEDRARAAKRAAKLAAAGR